MLVITKKNFNLKTFASYDTYMAIFFQVNVKSLDFLLLIH